jgi:hypothetical protein
MQDREKIASSDAEQSGKRYYRNLDAEALHRLVDLLAEDLLATPDEEVLAEAADHGGRQAERAEAREAIARALHKHGRHPEKT